MFGERISSPCDEINDVIQIYSVFVFFHLFNNNFKREFQNFNAMSGVGRRAERSKSGLRRKVGLKEEKGI